jgi:hypothetical protein
MGIIREPRDLNWRDLKAGFGLSSSSDWRAIMNYLLFGLEILLIVMGVALVPARSELRICRSRVTYNGRPELKTPRS